MTNYTPPRTNSSYTVNRLIGKLRTKPDNSAIQILLEEGGKITLASGDFPDYVVPEMGGQEFQFTFSEDKTKLFGVKPLVGMFKGRVVKYIGDGDAPPMYRTKSYTYQNSTVEYQYFLVEIEITSPAEFTGIQFTHMLRYNYRMAEDGKNQVVGYASKGKHTEHLIEFDDVVSVWQFGAMAWSENILPEVQDRVLRAGKEFQFSMKDGWINDVYPLVSPVKAEEVEGFDDGDFFANDALVDPGWEDETPF